MPPEPMIMIDRNGRSRCTGNRDHGATGTVDHVAPETVIIIDRNAQGDEIVAALDLKADRQARKLVVQKWTWIVEERTGLKAAIEAAMVHFQRFQMA
jgi:hypothetical protein